MTTTPATPETRVRELEAQVERLRKQAQEYDWLIGRQSFLLTQVANALKGKPKPLHLHDWSDLPMVARKLAKKAKRTR